MLRSRLPALAVPLALALALGLAGCPEDMSQAQAPSRPAEALSALVAAAKAGDVESFKRGLSRDFVATVERYQELGAQKGELKGAFDWQVFMRSLALSGPAPSEELIKGDKAIVKAAHADGREVQTDMILEDGRWKLAVPPGMVKNLDHFEDVEKMVKGEPVEPRPDLPRGGGGKADRAKSLPADASEADRKKAVALDAFDLGDLAGAERLVKEALEATPDEEALTVALGRIYVQTGRTDEARALYEGHLKTQPGAVPVMHYLGMVYMFANQPSEAAAQWKSVLKKDSAYAAEFKLEQRIAAAEAMAKAASGQLGEHGSGVMPAPPEGTASPH